MIELQMVNPSKIFSTGWDQYQMRNGWRDQKRALRTNLFLPCPPEMLTLSTWFFNTFGFILFDTCHIWRGCREVLQKLCRMPDFLVSCPAAAAQRLFQQKCNISHDEIRRVSDWFTDLLHIHDVMCYYTQLWNAVVKIVYKLTNWSKKSVCFKALDDQQISWSSNYHIKPNVSLLIT